MFSAINNLFCPSQVYAHEPELTMECIEKNCAHFEINDNDGFIQIEKEEALSKDIIHIPKSGGFFGDAVVVDKWDALISNIETYLDADTRSKQLAPEVEKIFEELENLSKNFKERAEALHKKIDPSNDGSKSDIPTRWEVLSELKDIVISYLHESYEKRQELKSVGEMFQNTVALRERALEDMGNSKEIQALMSSLDFHEAHLEGREPYLASEPVHLEAVIKGIKRIQELNEQKLTRDSKPHAHKAFLQCV